MAKRTVRRPTEEAALVRVTREEQQRPVHRDPAEEARMRNILYHSDDKDLLQKALEFFGLA